MKHWAKAQTRYDVHSPFVYNFVTKVLPHTNTLEGARIDVLRQEALTSKTLLDIEDFGAGYGGKRQSSIQKTVRQVAKSSARGRREGELLLRIAKAYAPSNVLELGTNLGFSTMYIMAGNPKSSVISVEGAQSLANYAKENTRKLNYAPQIINQEFGAFFESKIFQNHQYDLVFMDGNHQYAPTIEYFNRILPQLNAGAVIILDDIYWSKGMEKAWKELCNHPQITVSIDLFSMGLLFFERPQVKEHFSFRFRPF